jgi:hypothetical protein
MTSMELKSFSADEPEKVSLAVRIANSNKLALFLQKEEDEWLTF